MGINKISIRKENVVPTKIHGAEVKGRRCTSDATTVLKGELMSDSVFEVSSTYKFEDNWEQTFGHKIATEISVAVKVEIGTDTWPVRGSTEIKGSLGEEHKHEYKMGGSESQTSTTKTVDRIGFTSGLTVEVPPFSAMQIVAVYTKYDAEVDWWGEAQCIGEDGTTVLTTKDVKGTWTGDVISENAEYEVHPLPCETESGADVKSPCEG